MGIISLLIRISVVFIGFAVSALAADPFVGTWKLNPAISTNSEGPTLRAVTMTIRVEGDTYYSEAQRTNTNGETTTQKTRLTMNQLPTKSILPGLDLAGRKLNEYTQELIFTDSTDKSVVRRRLNIVSPDGRMLAIITLGSNKGKSTAEYLLYEKQ